MIEKKVLAATWAYEKFRDFVMGLDFELQTNYKPLVPLLALHFAPTVVHLPGKDQITADALSRATVDGPDSQDVTLVDNVETFTSQTIDLLPASQNKLLEIRDAQREDVILRQVMQYVQVGWPAYIPEQPLMRLNWSNHLHFTMISDLVLYDKRSMIPVNL